ncbi:MAG: dTDP-4-dehydrorhamnose reductase, partial [Anaerolineales bacterium]
QPEIIVNAAAYTAVDRAEQEPDLAMAVNSTAPGVMAEEALKLGAALIHYSSDYVFDGTKGAPYVETDAPKPINTYGRTKLEGEQAIQAVGGAYIILRTSWVYSLRRESFVSKVLRWAREQEVLHVVEDQIGSPTWARMLAEVTAQLLGKANEDVCAWAQDRHGIYHVAGAGAASRLQWARQILACSPHRDQHKNRHVEPARSSDFPTPAARPPYSALDCRKFEMRFHMPVQGWEEMLRLALE